MEDFIQTKLQPTASCVICTEAFDTSHQPVALRCNHVFGHECIKTWLREGRGNTNSCPFCRYAIYDTDPEPAFDCHSIWESLCEQPPEHLHDFLSNLWARLQRLWQAKPSGDFSTVDVMQRVVLPALTDTAETHGNPFTDALSLAAASWESLNRPDEPYGLGIPLVRLVRLMSQASSILPKWITTVQRTSMLFWSANAALGLTQHHISWDHMMEAAQLENERYFPLLHLYTVLISQHIAHTQPENFQQSQRKLIEWVVKRYCEKIGGGWSGKPSGEFKRMLAGVYGSLGKYQVEEKRISLRGHAAEVHVVRGMWATTMWRKEKVGGNHRVSASPVRVPAKSSSEWIG